MFLTEVSANLLRQSEDWKGWVATVGLKINIMCQLSNKITAYTIALTISRDSGLSNGVSIFRPNRVEAFEIIVVHLSSFVKDRF